MSNRIKGLLDKWTPCNPPPNPKLIRFLNAIKAAKEHGIEGELIVDGELYSCTGRLREVVEATADLHGKDPGDCFQEIFDLCLSRYLGDLWKEEL